MHMCIICLVFICLIVCYDAHLDTSWGECSYVDDVRSDVISIKTNIRSLLQSSEFQISDDDIIEFLSAKCNKTDKNDTEIVIAAYKITLNAGINQHVIISYYHNTLNKTLQDPTDLKVLDHGYKYVDIEDLYIQDADIRSLLLSHGADINHTSNVEYISAIQQNKAAKDGPIEYTVAMNICPYNNIIISFEVAHHQNNLNNLQLISAGYKRINDSYEAVADLQDVRLAIFNSIQDVRKLLNASLSDDIIALYAQSKDADNGWKRNYIVTLNAGERTSVIMQYFITLPVYDEALSHSTRYPLDLKVISAGVIPAAFEDVDDLRKVKQDIQRGDEQIRSLLNIEEDTQIIVTSAKRKTMIGMKYQVTISASFYVDLVIQYFMDLPQNDAQQLPKFLELIDAGDGDTIQSVRNEPDSESVTMRAVAMIVDVTAIVLVTICGISLIVYFYRDEKQAQKDTNGLYAKLNDLLL